MIKIKDVTPDFILIYGHSFSIHVGIMLDSSCTWNEMHC